jgi:hypothetical protein
MILIARLMSHAEKILVSGGRGGSGVKVRKQPPRRAKNPGMQEDQHRAEDEDEYEDENEEMHEH